MNKKMERKKSGHETSTNEKSPGGDGGGNTQPPLKPIYGKTRDFVVYMTHFNIAIYALCFWIQTGVLPYLTRKLGVDTKTFGILQSVFAFVQLCGGPIFGRFGDLFGGKYALMLAFFACFSSYGLLAIAANIPMLFISRLPSVSMHCMQGSQMVITDVTTDQERAGGIGRLGISYGVGMVLGPLIGGFVTDRFSEQTAATAAAFGSLVSIMLVFLFIPANTKSLLTRSENKKEPTEAEPGSVLDIKKYSAIFLVPNFTYIFAIKMVSSLPLGILQAMFSLIAMDYFHLGPKGNGLVLSYVGIMGMLVQGIGVSFLTKRYSDTKLIKSSIVLLVVSYTMLMFVANIQSFLFVLVPLIIGGSVSSVIITSVVTKTVPSHDTGAALGLLMATHSLIRTISPTIGGFLYGAFGFPMFGVVGALINGALALYLIQYCDFQLDVNK